ncbi:MAG: hypothetical protein AAGA85_01165 [Bacteroidota bacterium]
MLNTKRQLLAAKFLFVSLSCFVLYPRAYAQVTDDPSMMIMNQGYYGYMRTFAPEPNIEGEYFYQKEDFPLMLHLTNAKAAYPAKTANINLLDQSVVLDLGKGKYAILPENIDSASVEGDLMLLNSRWVQNFEERNVLLFVLHESDNLKLVKSIDAFLMDPTYNEATNTGNRNFTIQQKTRYYFLVGEDAVLPLSKGGKQLKTLDQYADIKQYMKQEKLSLREEADLISLSGYLESLL